MDKKTALLQACKSVSVKISPRAENMKWAESRDLYVDMPEGVVGRLPDLSAPYNQIIYGRRGSGKTHLLKKVALDGKPWNDASGYLAFYFSANEFLRSIESDSQESAKIRARDCFRSFLEDFESKLVSTGDQILKHDSLWSRFGLNKSLYRDQFQTVLLDLAYVLKRGQLIPRLSKSKAKLSSSYIKENTTSSHVDHSAAGKASVFGPAVTGKLGVSIDAGENIERGTYEGGHKREVDYYSRSVGLPAIRRSLRELGSIIDTPHIYILIDEWSSLGEMQIDFAEMLHRTLFQLDFIVVKLAGYRHTTSLSNGASQPHFRGIEINADIFEAGDLDWEPSNPKCVDFFYRILYKRLLYVEPSIANYYGPMENFDSTTFTDDVFTRGANKRLVLGSHGIVRDFLSAFENASQAVEWGIYPRAIRNSVVDSALIKLSRIVESETAESNDIGGFLHEKIKPLVARTGKPYFFVRIDSAPLNADVRNLVARRFLHPVSTEQLHNSIAEEYRCFRVAQGFYLRWMKAAMFNNKDLRVDEGHMDGVSDVTLDSVKEHELPIDAKSVNYLLCQHCSKTFPTDSDSFLKARLCPHCYKDNSSQTS